MVQKQAKIFYYKNKNDTKHIGSINLVEALRIEVAKEGKTHFKIYTPRRIWHLAAENEETAAYWVNGVTKIINALKQEDDSSAPAPHRASVRLETMENRIRDLESTDDLLKRALAIAAAKAGVTVDELLKQAEADGEEDTPAQAAPAKAEAKEEATAEAPAEAEAENAPVAEEETAVAKEAPVADNSAAEEANAEEEADDGADSDDQKSAEEPDKPKKFQATVLYDYTAQQDYEMTIKSGETIAVLSKHGNGWWLGATGDGKQGYFPGSYVEPI